MRICMLPYLCYVLPTMGLATVGVTSAVTSSHSANLLMWPWVNVERGSLSNLASYCNITCPNAIWVYNLINEALHVTIFMLLPTMKILPPFWFIRLNSKISPSKVDGEWWNTFCSLQKHLINALVFLKKICLSMH